jgi:hypothetical protein
MGDWREERSRRGAAAGERLEAPERPWVGEYRLASHLKGRWRAGVQSCRSRRCGRIRAEAVVARTGKGVVPSKGASAEAGSQPRGRPSARRQFAGCSHAYVPAFGRIFNSSSARRSARRGRVECSQCCRRWLLPLHVIRSQASQLEAANQPMKPPFSPSPLGAPSSSFLTAWWRRCRSAGGDHTERSAKKWARIVLKGRTRTDSRRRPSRHYSCPRRAGWQTRVRSRPGSAGRSSAAARGRPASQSAQAASAAASKWASAAGAESTAEAGDAERFS